MFFLNFCSIPFGVFENHGKVKEKKSRFDQFIKENGKKIYIEREGETIICILFENIRFDVYEGFCNLKHVRFLAKFKLKLKNYLWVLCYLVMEFCYNIFSVLLVRVKTEDGKLSCMCISFCCLFTKKLKKISRVLGLIPFASLDDSLDFKYQVSKLSKDMLDAVYKY